MLFAVFTVMLMAVFLPNLMDLGYWPTDAETFIYAGISIVLAGVLTLLSKIHAQVGRFLIGVLIYWIADSYFLDGAGLAIAIGVVVLILLNTRLETSIRSMALVFAAVFVISSLVTGTRPLLTQEVAGSSEASPQAANLPPIVHIVLDEFMSPDAAARIGMLDQATADALDADYVQRGFKVFTAARSVAGSTRISVSNMLGLGETKEPYDYNTEQSRKDGVEYNIVKENRWADTLKALGYRITAITTSYINLCTKGVDECYSYRANGEGHSMTRFSGSLWQRTIFPLLVMDFHYYNKGHLGKVALYRLISKPLAKAGFKILPRGFQLRVGSALAVMDDLDQRLTNIHRGEAYFAHILLPHNPHILNAACELKPMSEWTITTYNKGDASDAQRYANFKEQMTCTHNRVMAIVDRVIASPEGKDAIFFIHGDHGARILRQARKTRPNSDLPVEEISDNLDPLFVVRAPAVLPAGIDQTPQIMQSLFRDLFLSIAK